MMRALATKTFCYSRRWFAAWLLCLPAAALADDTVELDRVTISSTHSQETADGPVTGYRATRSASATRTDTAIEDIPQAISVVPEQVLDDLNISRMDKALDFAGGVGRGNNFGGVSTLDYSLRGFISANTYRNGFASYRGTNAAPDMAVVERVEVLKGPSSGLFGRSEPGGVINMVTKRPQNDNFTRIKLSAGRWDRYRGTLDANARLTDDLLGRVNLVLEDNGSFRDHVENQRYIVSPSISWSLGENTSLLLDTEFSRTDIVMDRGIAAVGNKLGKMKNSTFLHEPDDGKISTEGRLLHISLQHHLNEFWKVRAATQYLDGHMQGNTTGTTTAPVLGDILGRTYQRREMEWNDINTQLDLHGDFELVGWQHQLLSGIEYSNYRYTQHLDFTAVNAINIYDPMYGQRPSPLPGRKPRQPGSQTHEENYAFNLADQIEFNERWHGLLGVRFEHFQQRLYAAGNRAKRSQNKEAAVPRAGLMYKLLPDVSVFANTGFSFKPNSPSTDATTGITRVFKPEEGIGYELGSKFSLLDGRLDATVSLFHITKENVLTRDPSDPTGTLSIAAGKVRSQGLDMQFSGQLTEQLRIIGAYAFIDAQVSKDNSGLKGNKILGVARHSGSLLTVYEFDGGSSIGASTTYFARRPGEANRPGGTTNDFYLPAYITFDFLARWQATRDLSFNINLDNVFNRTYYERGYSRSWVVPGAPRNLTLGLSVKF